MKVKNIISLQPVLLNWEQTNEDVLLFIDFKNNKMYSKLGLLCGEAATMEVIKKLNNSVNVIENIQWQYEYDGMIINEIDFVDYLTDRGDAGWELVFASGDFVGGRDVRMIWKKQK